jgi:hypothetical protein
MIEAINPLVGNAGQTLAGMRAANSIAAKQEFLTMFYKELLKQSIKAPNLSGSGNEDEGSSAIFSSFSNDVMVEKLANELARKAVNQMGWVAPEAPK